MAGPGGRPEATAAQGRNAGGLEQRGGSEDGDIVGLGCILKVKTKIS